MATSMEEQPRSLWSDVNEKQQKIIQKELLGFIIDGNFGEMKKLIEKYSELKLDYCVYINNHKDSPLHLAAFHGHLDIVEYLIVEKDCFPELRNRFRNTPLHRAARQGQLEVIKYLVEVHHCNPMCLCNWGRTPLHHACNHNQLEVVKYLMECKGVDVNVRDKRKRSTPLDLAADSGSLDVVIYMTEVKKCYDQSLYQGLDTPLHYAAHNGREDVVLYLVAQRIIECNVKGNRGRTPLHSACKGGKLNTIKYLLEIVSVFASERDDEHGLTPLDLAAEYAPVEVLIYMLEERHDGEMTYPGENVYSTLHHAAYGGKLENVKYLIGNYPKRFTPDCRGCKGKTPLHSACRGGKNDVVEYLIMECDVDPLVRDDSGNTPLHSAAKNGDRSVVELLLSTSDCDPGVVNNVGQDAAAIAKDLGHKHTYEYLLEANKVYKDYTSIGEEDMKLFTKGMSHGYIESAIPLIVFMGVAGSGKSEFQRLVLDQPVPEFSPSTPLADPAVRSMSVCQVAVDDKDDDIEWTFVGPQKMLNMVANTIKGEEFPLFQPPRERENAATQSSMSNAPAEVNDTPQQEVNNESKEETLQAEHHEDGSHQQEQQNSSNTFADALKDINIDTEIHQSMSNTSGGNTKLMDVDFIYLLDSGGQPAFREMLPHFVQQASAVVLMQKLNERLDEKPTIRYREEGGKVDKGYISELTNEQILHQYVQGVQSHKHSRVFVIGTHRDKEGDCENETKKDKNKKLLEGFLPVLGEQIELYHMGKPDQLIFPVNCTSREADDEAVAREFRRRVKKCIKEKEEKKKIPLPWFILEQLLQLLAQKMNVSVLNIDECCEAAQQKLLMPRNVCEAALRYLSRLNIIFYRPDILPGVVFSSAQVILDKITELVRCNHALRTEGENINAVPSYIKSGSGLKFREYGLLDFELLNRDFPSHYRQNLFASPNFLLLLEKMLIAGRLNDTKYFIPSLLPNLSVEKIAEYRATADHPSPLVIYYPEMWLPVGVMSSLVVYLQNTCQWVPAQRGRAKPTCMKHNCVEFVLPGEPGSIVLIDSVKFLEIHVKLTEELDTKLLCGIRDNVKKGLEKAHNSLHYSPPQTEFGFLCTTRVCGNEEPHLATLVGGGKWRCYENTTMGGKLNGRQTCWFYEELRTNDPKAEDSGECPEITKLRENLTLITRTVTAGGSPQHFANKLVEKAFLPHHTAQQILNTLGSTPDQQASKLMDSVFTKIEHSERKEEWFEEFVDIFSSEPAYDVLVKKLNSGKT